MWQKGWRDQVWSGLNQKWDILVIGGGITGAGIFRMAAQAGAKVLLIEARDFSSGTSSRSSKLIHGGLRYIKNRQYDVTHESVRERERLLHDAPDLVSPLEFILPLYESYKTKPWKFAFSLGLYDLFGFKWAHGKLSEEKMKDIRPAIIQNGLMGFYFYFDASVDDARLVLRNLREGVKFGGYAINYVDAKKLLFDRSRQVCGVAVQDMEQEGENRSLEIQAQVVINATGPWTDDLRAEVSPTKIIRKSRGSHILFSHGRLPIEYGYSLIHPVDHRSLFVVPWEGVTVVGTTDLDQPSEYDLKFSEPFMTKEEEEYLLVAANYLFPGLDLTSMDIISSFAGLRPIVSEGKDEPSDESRAHCILEEKGLITITGGKLTTYRKMGYETLQKARTRINKPLSINSKTPIFLNSEQSINENSFDPETLHRWSGRFGSELPDFISAIKPAESNIRIEDSIVFLAELRWAARNEGVIHLDDLLLRRARIGLLLPNGGLDQIELIKRIVQEELLWDENKWQNELVRYKNLWESCYSLQK